jgi:hypothetical protein
VFCEQNFASFPRNCEQDKAACKRSDYSANRADISLHGISGRNSNEQRINPAYYWNSGGIKRRE